MRVRVAPAIVCLAMLPTAVIAAPAQLYGKSIIVTWSETRVQRNVGESNFRTVSANHELSVYIGSTGRVFNKLQNTTRAGTGANEQVAGQGDSTRVPSFSGRTMIFVQPQQGMARRISVEFDKDFSSCTASAVRGKQSGASSGFATSMITGRRLEVQSASTSSETCSVRAGNVFEGR